MTTRKTSNHSARVESHGWNYCTDSPDPGERAKLEEMLGAAKRFASAMERGDSPYTLSLVGPSGTGKTHLGNKLSHFFRSYIGRHGGAVSWRRLCNDIRDGQRGMIYDLERDPFVFFDDVGAEYQSASGYTVSVFDGLLAARTGRAWTVVTSNLSLRQIGEDWDFRIASRMRRDGCEVIDCRGARDFYGRPDVQAIIDGGASR